MSENPEDQNPEVDGVVDYMDDQQESAAPRVARSVSNQPLISEEQEREHSGGTIPSRPVRRPAPRARRMSLSLTRVDAWSVAKVTFMLSIAAGLIQIVAAGLLWALLNMVGVFDQITQLVSTTGPGCQRTGSGERVLAEHRAVGRDDLLDHRGRDCHGADHHRGAAV